MVKLAVPLPHANVTVEVLFIDTSSLAHVVTELDHNQSYCKSSKMRGDGARLKWLQGFERIVYDVLCR